jgi:hypothetical protein
MAGRPVTVRSGPSGATVGMIASLIIAVALLVMFILQLTSNKQLLDRALTAERVAEKYGRAPSYYEEEATNRKTGVFAVMEDDRRRVAQLVTGVPDAVGITIVEQSNQLLSDLAKGYEGSINPNDTLLTALKRFGDLFGRSQEEKTTLSAQVSSLQGEVESLTAQLNSQRTEFENTVAGLDKQMRGSEEDKIRQLQNKDDQLAALQDKLNSLEQQLQTLKREGLQAARLAEAEVQRLLTQIGDLQTQIQVLKPAAFDPNAILTKADGKVLRAIPGSDVVYISLGSTDKIKVGMGFEVYSQTRETPKGLRGKASLEVVTLMDDTAECRVMRADPAQPIIEGDYIVNIAYERGRLPKFVVMGDFDLNYDGNPDYDGRDKIISMIKQWGGQVVDDLDESVDYVVIGLGPQPPTFAPGQAVSDVVRDQAQQKALEQSKFHAVVERARSMFIPVITQNQFLFLTGYVGEEAFARR